MKKANINCTIFSHREIETYNKVQLEKGVLIYNMIGIFLRKNDMDLYVVYIPCLNIFVQIFDNAIEIIEE